MKHIKKYNESIDFDDIDDEENDDEKDILNSIEDTNLAILLVTHDNILRVRSFLSKTIYRFHYPPKEWKVDGKFKYLLFVRQDSTSYLNYNINEMGRTKSYINNKFPFKKIYEL